MRRHFTKLSVLFLALSSVACGYDNDGKDHVEAAASSTVSYATIDTDAKMTNLDSGVGLFIEYASGGTWTVQFACDTATTKLDCLWNVYAYTPVGGRIYSYKQLDLEAEDYVTLSSDGELSLQPRTTTNLDGIEFVADKGEPVTFSVSLDGEDYPNDYVFWMSDGKVVQGAETTAVELTPTDP
jgi:hypothetical protein